MVRRESKIRHQNQLPTAQNVDTGFLIDCHSKQGVCEYAHLRDMALIMDKFSNWYYFLFVFPSDVDADYFCYPGDLQVCAPDSTCQVCCWD